MTALNNNLLNIRRGDQIYQLTMRRMADALKLESERLAIIAADAYYLYYSYRPLLRPWNEDAVLERARRLFDDVMRTAEYAKVRPLTRYNRVLSEVYAMLVIRKLMENVERARKWMERVKSRQQRQQSGQQQGQPQQQGGGQQQNQQGQAPQQQGQRQQDELFDEAMGRALEMTTADELMRETAKDFERAKEIYDMFLAAGREVPPEVLVDYAEQLRSARADRILRYTEGLMARLRYVHVERRDTPRGLPNGYVKTRRLERMLPRELAVEELLDVKLAEGGLAYRRTAVRQGDVVAAVDDSGSMEGQKEVWARSVAMALYRLALMSKRRFRLILFDQEVRVNTSSIEEILDALLHKHYGGGTCIDCAIRAALEAGEYRTIVVISDGIDDVKTPPEALRGRRLVAVMISGDNDALKRLAEESGGAYMRAVLNEEGALDVIAEAGLI